MTYGEVKRQNAEITRRNRERIRRGHPVDPDLVRKLMEQTARNIMERQDRQENENGH